MTRSLQSCLYTSTYLLKDFREKFAHRVILQNFRKFACTKNLNNICLLPRFVVYDKKIDLLESVPLASQGLKEAA